ncbi:alpha/beta fold hydrolase [Propioniciclava sp. MC1683]|uniref:alpha/beta fold hydrolase n=1 Tax=Propioniciclava sp. MC1683 TaxID=2760309 RepID=UPI001C725495|nr:alpha/beta fold hydrolase [Propioniciclava sp. MC1683]
MTAPVYPRTEPHVAGMLTLSDGAELAWECSGNPTAIPAVHLHGGPGGGRGRRGFVRTFDPERYRVIAYDQRGCGASLPRVDPVHGRDAHTLERYVADLEELRRHLGVEAWLLYGVSWGSTLALAYAQAHPGRVLAVSLAAVTTTSAEEVTWLSEGVGRIHPEAHAVLVDTLCGQPEGYRPGEEPLVTALDRLMGSPDATVRRAVAAAWTLWEDHHVSLGAGGFTPVLSEWPPAEQEAFTVLVARLWNHIAFGAPGGAAPADVLGKASALPRVPAQLVHGRLDVSGPVVTAWRLHRAWPGSELVVVEDEGHGGPRMMRAVTDFHDRVAARA